MPNLINVLREQGKRTNDGEGRGGVKESQTEEERQKEVERALKAGMEWGTCFVFSCGKDCCAEGENGWKEEMVLVQWDE
jgi:pre-rRNA-processing protein TSR4